MVFPYEWGISHWITLVTDSIPFTAFLQACEINVIWCLFASSPLFKANTLVPSLLPSLYFNSFFHTEYVWKQLPEAIRCIYTIVPWAACLCTCFLWITFPDLKENSLRRSDWTRGSASTLSRMLLLKSLHTCLFFSSLVPTVCCLVMYLSVRTVAGIVNAHVRKVVRVLFRKSLSPKMISVQTNEYSNNVLHI